MIYLIPYDNILVDTSELFGNAVKKAERTGSFCVNENNAMLKICDEWEFEYDNVLLIEFMSYAPWMIDGHSASVTINGVCMQLSFDSESDFILSCDDSMSEYELKKMYRLRLRTASGKFHRITFKGRVYKYEV